MPGKNPQGPHKHDRQQHERREHSLDLKTGAIDKQAGPVGAPSRFPAEQEIGGSRPGVPSRMKRALEDMDE